jgi:glycosyltransferase involved in cell wall biosynthesis
MLRVVVALYKHAELKGMRKMEPTTVDIVCVSHLWWDWVWQRPQHLLSRLAQRNRVLWVEEPHIEIGPLYDAFEVRDIQPNLQVTRLVLSSDDATFWERLNGTLDRTGGHAFKVSPDIREASLLFESPEQPRLEREVMDYLATWKRGPLVLWLYTPVVVHLIDQLQPDLVVYDVMDELTGFKFAPPRLIQQEQELVSRADLMFTGGPSLHEARIGRHPDMHLFPSGVEQQHFAQALDDDLAVPSQLQQLNQPIIGYYGVIDERLDLELLARIAQLRPNWNWVMIGPILKVQAHELPQLPNIHYLGKQEYRDLPAFLKGFNVAMMPFARNEATRFISPTKTLEYMAGHKPIVSTPIKDVIDLYGDVVRIADTAEQFVEQVQAALDEQPHVQAERHRRENELLGKYEWDNIAETMQRLMVDRLLHKLA